jgi:hypothetical protein
MSSDDDGELQAAQGHVEAALGDAPGVHGEAECTALPSADADEQGAKRQRRAPAAGRSQPSEAFQVLSLRTPVSLKAAGKQQQCAAAGISLEPLSTRACEQLRAYGLSLVPKVEDLVELKVVCKLIHDGSIKLREVAQLCDEKKILTSYNSLHRYVYGHRKDATTMYLEPLAYLTATSAPKARLSTRRASTRPSSSRARQEPTPERSCSDSERSKRSRAAPQQVASDSKQGHHPDEQLLELGGQLECISSCGESGDEEPSEEPSISLEEAVHRNLRVPRHRGSDRETGVERLVLPLSQAELSELAAAIRVGFDAGKQSGKRVSCLWSHAPTGRTITATGYRSYGAINGRHNAAAQFKATCVLKPELLWSYCGVLPHLSTILQFAQSLCSGPDRAIAYVHLLDQTSEQAQFTWHVDNNSKDGDYGEVEVSFVFCVTDTPSSMQVAGKAKFHYEGAGSGCMFHSSLWHASGHAAPGTLKVAVFLCKRK